MGIHETFGEDLLGFPRIHKTLREFVIHGDSQGFVRLWERICNDS